MNITMRVFTCFTSIILAWASYAQVILQDGFESGAFKQEWSLTSGVAIQTGSGAVETTNFAAVAAYNANTGREFGARFDALAPEGAREFYVDFFVRCKTTANRQLNLHVTTSAGTMASATTPSINLRYQTNAWSVYNGSAWVTINGLAPMLAEQWHRVRVSGHGWGETGVNYDLLLSDAGSTNFSSSASNLTVFHGGTPNTLAARYFLFSSVYGNNPGFDVDEVSASISGVAPPETNAIMNISGTYPHLAVFSGEGEIGMGGVAPWAGKLWFITYPPHKPSGSADKLWTVDSNLTLIARPESVGGTHANRFIHRETQQLILGPYLVDTNAAVRVISPTVMPGRLTGTARHLTDPTNRVFFYTMERGLYEVQLDTLAVNTIYRDGNVSGSAPLAPYPGTHGKGGYSGQGRLLYSNNGESGWSVGSDPNFNGPAGVLTEHLGTNWSDSWTTVERKTFTEITGPGGISGPANDDDPIWSLGWDKRSVILKLLDHGVWQTFRLPKASYSQDALHGWYTEWPRIREITNGWYLMHMHGMFYNFPGGFSVANTHGIRPLCTHLKMPVDYCWWNGQLVMGRDDASTTGGNQWAGQSHSAPWFGQISDLETWGAPAGFGGPWKDDTVTAGEASTSFLVSGFKKRILHLKHRSAQPVEFTIQYDLNGSGAWTNLASVSVPANGYAWHLFSPALNANWIRVVPGSDASGVTAYFHLGNPPTAPTPDLFAGIADVRQPVPCSDGILRPKSGDARTLQFAANFLDASGALAGTGYYEIGASLQLRRVTNATAENTLRTTYSLSNAGFSVDAASLIYTQGTSRFRLPKSASAYDASFASGWPRAAREVVTERQLFNAHGTFYELPLSGSGGFRRIRPVTTHNKHISDFGSWRGLFAIAGVSSGATNYGHVFRSDDGQAALWFGNVDDLWRMGQPSGVGGPWTNSAVLANTPSDPYLMYGYDRKVLELSHAENSPVTFTIEVDFAADNTWSEYARFTVEPGRVLRHIFPDGYSAHWVRLKTDLDARVTTMFTYGPAVPEMGGISRMSDGNVQLSFSGSVGQGYTVLASSELASPLTGWSVVTNGIFSSTPATVDVSAIDHSQRFFVISMP